MSEKEYYRWLVEASSKTRDWYGKTPAWRWEYHSKLAAEMLAIFREKYGEEP
jgi:hypothetical protein